MPDRLLSPAKKTLVFTDFDKVLLKLQVILRHSLVQASDFAEEELLTLQIGPKASN